MYKTMYTPDGKTSVEVLPHNVSTMTGRGWLLKKPAAKRAGSSSKPETKDSKDD